MSNTVFAFKEKECEIFEKVVENAEKVLKTPERLRTGRQMYDSEVLLALHQKDEANGIGTGNHSQSAFTVSHVQDILNDVLHNAQISKATVTRFVKMVIHNVYIPSYVNIGHQQDHEAVAFRANVVEDLMADPNLRTRSSDSAVEAITSAVRLALPPKDEQYGDGCSTIKDGNRYQHSRPFPILKSFKSALIV